MAARTWQALVLGTCSEAREIFERPMFQEQLPTELVHVVNPEDFDQALEEHPPPNVVLIDVDPDGLAILDKVREHFPVSPVVMVGEPENADVLIEALKNGLERHLMRLDDKEKFASLLAQVIYQVLQQTVEPPSIETPSAEEMLRYAQYHHILHPFFLVGKDGRLLYINAVGERLIWKLVGRSPVIGERLADELLEGLGEPFVRQIEEALDGQESVIQYNFEQLESPQQRNVHCTPLPTPSGRTVAASVSIHQQVPPEVERTQTMRAISRFAGGIAHDFNNLLNVMVVQGELLGIYLDDISAPAEKCLQSIERAGDQGSELTRQLMAISYETLTIRTSIEINELLESLDPRLRKMLRGSQTLDMELSDATLPVQADPQQVEQLVTNLVENAIEALGNDGEILVRTAVVGGEMTDQAPRGLGPGRWLVLSVEDTGPGVRPALHSRIFEPFFTTHRAQGHSGLGLTLVHAVVEQLGGRIFVDSEPGEGAVFSAFLPAGDESAVPAHPDEPVESAAAESTRRTVLLVEDEDDLRLPFREALVQGGFVVLEANDVPSALELIEARGDDIDAVVSDVIMPGGSGLDVVKALVESHPDVKVVFVSGHTAEVLEETNQEWDISYDFLAKPVSLGRLVAVVKQLLEDS